MTRTTNPTPVGHLIRRARIRAGMTQGQLALMSGVKHRTSINHIERGRWNPSPELVARILGVCHRASGR